MRDRKNVVFLKQDPDPGSGFKILIWRIRIRPKMDRIRNPGWISEDPVPIRIQEVKLKIKM